MDKQRLHNEMKAFLGPPGGRRVAVVGIGNAVRRDDAAGLRVIELLQGKGLKDVLLLRTETVPESYTGVIRDYAPTHVILIDAAAFNGSPGAARTIPPEKIANATVSTHSLPLSVFIGYVAKTICLNIVLIGIQGEDNGMGEGLTPEVEEGARKVATLLEELLE